MNHLDNQNYRLKKLKLTIAQQEANTLRHTDSIDDCGVTVLTPEKKNVESILNLPELKDIHGVHQVLGSFGFYHQFLLNYSELTEPLH